MAARPLPADDAADDPIEDASGAGSVGEPGEPGEPGEASEARRPGVPGTSSEPQDDVGGSAPMPAAPGVGGQDDVDARWREIVARLGDLGREPAQGADTPREERPPVTPGGSRPAREPVPPPAGDPAELPGPPGYRGWSPDPAAEEAESHFEPPDPGPVLGGDPLLTLAWAGAVGVPLLLVLAVTVWQDVPMLVLQGAGALFLAAVSLLIWRMPQRDDDDRGPGAVV